MRQTLAVLRNRNMALLLLGRVISTSGDWIYQVALLIAIYQYSHHKSYLIGLFWLVRLIPSLVLGPFSGALADRVGYRRAMIGADLARMVLVVILAVFLNSGTWYIIYPIAFLVMTGSSLFNPANVGLIPRLVSSPEERLAANSAVMQVTSIAIIGGSAVGGFATQMGYSGLLLLDAGTFAVSAICLAFLRPRATAVPRPATGDTAGVVEDEGGGGIRGSFRLVSSRPLLMFAASVMALPELASGAVMVWLVPYSVSVLHLGSSGVGYLYAALGIGVLLGGFAAAMLGGNLRLDQLLVAGTMSGAIALTLVGVVPIGAAAIAFLLVLGLSETIEYAAFETLLQQAVPETMIGRASGTMNSFLANMVIVGNVISGFLTLWLSLPVAIAAVGLLTITVTALAWWNLHRKTAGQPNATTLAIIPVFATVQHSVREWAVRRMVREQFARGDVVIRQGDTGDKFYTIARGTVDVEAVTENETVRRQIGSGDFFGEIALLKNVPRTATVSAATDVTVWTLSREDFEELQERAAEFKESLLETATVRMGQIPNLQLGLATRA